MQDTVEVIINPDGKSCTTLNQLSTPEVGREKLYSSHDTSPESQFYHENWHKRHKAWQQAEFERKTYEIDIDKSSVIFLSGKRCTVNKVSGLYFPFSSTHQAQIINNKAVIL